LDDLPKGYSEAGRNPDYIGISNNGKHRAK